MARHHFYSYVQDSSGNIAPSANVSVYKAGAEVTATAVITVYDAEISGSSFSATPQVTSGLDGKYDFWLDDADYTATMDIKLIITHSDLTTASINYVTIPRSAAIDDDATSLTVTWSANKIWSNIEITGGVIDDVPIGQTTATAGSFKGLTGNLVTATTLEAVTGHITTLTSNDITATSGTIITSDSTTFNSNLITATTLEVSTGHITSFTSNSVTATSGTIVTLESTTGYVTTLKTDDISATTVTVGDLAHLKKGLKTNIVTTSSDYSLTASSHVLIVNASCTIALHTAIHDDRGLNFKIINNSSDTITASCMGSDTIEGDATVSMKNRYDSMTLLIATTNLYILV